MLFVDLDDSSAGRFSSPSGGCDFETALLSSGGGFDRSFRDVPLPRLFLLFPTLGGVVVPLRRPFAVDAARA